MNYAKPEPGQPCVLEIADKKLELLFTLKVLKQLEADHGIKVLKGEGLGTMMQDPALLGTVLFYGVKTKNPEITEDWIDNNVDASMLLDLSPMLVRAITGKWFDIDKYVAARLPNADRPAETTEGTGSPSGPLAATTSTALN